MNKLFHLYEGKLTYTVALAAIVYGLVSLVAQLGDPDTNIGIVWTGLAVFGIRRKLG